MKYGKLGTQPAFFYCLKGKIKIGNKVTFKLGKRNYPVLDGIVTNVEPLRIDYI